MNSEPPPAGNLGTAMFAMEAEAVAALGTRTTSTISFGRFFDPVTEEVGGEIAYGGERHILLFGPNGSGKGTRFLVPNLLGGMIDQSVIVIDPKGELAAVTAQWRRSQGHRVVILNPFNVLGLGSAGFNPLDSLDPESDTFFDDANAIGEALIKIEGSDPHWSESAQGLMVSLLMWEKLLNGARANLENVRAMLTEPKEYKDVRNEHGDIGREVIKGLPATARVMAVAGGPEIESLAARFTNETRETASIQSSADTQTRWLLSRPMRADLKKNGIDFRTLKDEPTTVYVVLPAERLRTHAVWLRLVIVTALRALSRPGGRRTVMLIDEMAALGHLPPLEDAFGIVRGFRIQIAAIFQDLAQLKALYKERWETFVANAGVVFGFGPNDLTTAEWMSKRAGQTTVTVKSFSATSGQSVGGQTSTSAGTSLGDNQAARPLFLPDELFGLEEGSGLLWLQALRYPVRFFAPAYWQIRECRERAKPNPYYLAEE